MKKIISILLAFIMLLSSIEVMAEETVSEISELISEIEFSNEEPEAQTTHTEIIPSDYVYPFEIDLEDEGFDMRQEVNVSDGGIALFSLDANTTTLWRLALLEQFSEEYLMPFRDRSGEQVIGNTNRLVYRETDLTLEGKNGLDLNISRRFDNQETTMHYLRQSYPKAEYSVGLFIFPFIRTDTGAQINIGFYSEDEYYLYMSSGAYVSEMPPTILTDQRETIYDFDSIYDKMTDNVTNIFLEPVPIDGFDVSSVSRETTYYLVARRLKLSTSNIGAGWSYDLPYSRIYRDTLEKYTGSTYRDYDIENSGVFIDLKGNVHSFTNDVYYAVNRSDDSLRSFSSRFYAEDDYMSYESFYQVQTLEPYGIEYNMTAYDKLDCLTYYMYSNTGVVSGTMTGNVVAVVDKFGNAIRYEYGIENAEASDEFVKITDTYGREIFLSTTGISYQDPDSNEVKRIDYNIEGFSKNEASHESLLSEKDFQRLTVTNEAGEQTIYDSRQGSSAAARLYSEAATFQTERPDFDTDAVKDYINYDLERIVYPNGKETHYRYQNFYFSMDATGVVRSVHALCERYDLDNGTEKNRMEYEFEEYPLYDHEADRSITAIRGDGRKTETVFNIDGLRKEDNTCINDVNTFKSYRYFYNSDDCITRMFYSIGNFSSDVMYTYHSRYHIASEYDDIKKVEYTYSDNGSTPEETVYSYYESGTGYVEDYVIEAPKLSETGKPEYERIVKDGETKSQSKYEYDEFGNITAIHTWLKDKNSDGILDFNDEYITINAEYEVTDKNTLSYTSFADNLLNADGENEGRTSLSYENNIFGSAILQTDSYGNETEVEYDELNRPVKITMPNGGVRSVEYNTEENYVILTDESGVKTRFIYDSLGSILKKQKYHDGEYKTFEEYTYDEVERVESAKILTSENKGTISAYEYDNLDRVTKTTVKDLSGTLLYTEENEYTAERDYYEIITQKTGSGNNALASTVKRYDEYGNLIYEAQIDGAEEHIFEYTYDYLGRMLTSKDANGNITTYTYDVFGNLLTETDAQNNVTSYSYDMAGRLISKTDALNNTSNFYYDGLSRKIKEALPFDINIKSTNKTYYDKNSNVIKQAIQNNDTDEAESFRITEFKYDSMGNLLASIGRCSDGDSVVQYEYNTANQPTKMITGLSAYSENPTGGNTTVYEYEDGFLSKITDPLGQSESYTYDFLGNLTTKTDRNKTEFKYNYGTYGLIRYNSKLRDTLSGELSWIENTISYDSFGRVQEEMQLSGENGHIIFYEYDKFGRVIYEGRGDNYTGSDVFYTYDANNNLTSYTLKENNTVKAQHTYSYNNLNQLTNQTIGDTIVTYEYNRLGNLSKYTMNNKSISYEYNDAQNVMSIKGTDSFNFVYYAYYKHGGSKVLEINSRSQTEYSYDNFDRLKQEQTILAGYKYHEFETNTVYTYDASGNRSSKTDKNGIITSYEYDANNRLVKETTDNNSIGYTYDPNGNLIVKRTNGTYTTEGTPSVTIDEIGIGLSSYEYDMRNRLTRFVTDGIEATYTYGVDNLRTSKTVNGVTTGYVWNNEKLVAETDGMSIQKVHNYIIDGIAETVEADGKTFYYKDDHGDIIFSVDKNSTYRNDYWFGAFGNKLVEEMEYPNSFGYAGEYHDAETGLIYLRNRYYDPSVGRFINEDPIRDGLNWYAYCNNNPVNFVDPLGLFDYDDRLSPNTEYNVDVKVMQNELAWLGYYSGEIDGYFGQKTLDAVNAYKNAMGLGNTGSDWGVVGKQTWETMGLIYRTQADIDAGVLILTIGNKQYFDITKPVTTAVCNASSEFAQHSGDLDWFRQIVGDTGKWNVKRNADTWSNTLGISKNSYNTKLLFYGRTVKIDDIGNITYGYLGKSANISDLLLRAGSMGNHIKNHMFGEFDNEFSDEAYIQLGIDWYNGINIQLGYGVK